MKPFYLLLLGVCLMCTSCYHVYYSPNTPNTPLLSQKGEVKLNGVLGFGANSEFTSGEVQVAVAATDHFGLMVNGFTAAKSERTTDFNGASHTEKGQGSYVEIALGLFMLLSHSGRWRAEVFAGLGSGAVTNDYGATSLSKVGITKSFIQPAIGYKAKHFEIAFSPKMSFVTWKVKSDRILESEHPYDKQDIVYIQNNPKISLFEPSLIIRAGGEQVKGQLGITLSNVNGFYYEATENGLLSLGFSIGLAGRKKSER